MITCNDCPLIESNRRCPVRSSAGCDYFSGREQKACLAGEKIFKQRDEIKRLRAENQNIHEAFIRAATDEKHEESEK